MPINIYYLDDEESLCNLFSDYLSSDEIHVTTFSSPDEAIEHTKKTPPDIFFIDYRLPGCTGDEVAESVSDSIPKILVTGDLSLSLSKKFRHIVSKPFLFDEIEKLINEI